MLKLIDQLLSDSPKGKVRNLGRNGTLALCALVWWTTKDLPAKIEAGACKCHQHSVSSETTSTAAMDSTLPDWPTEEDDQDGITVHAREP